MKTRHKRLAVSTLVAFVLASAPVQATGILLFGDSWATPMPGPLGEVLTENGYPDVTVEYIHPFLGQAKTLSSQEGLDSISNALVNKPDTKIVHLSIGGNDWLNSNWVPSWAGTPAEDDLITGIVQDVNIIVDHILSLRPDVQILWSSYDFPRPINVRGGHYKNPADINAFLLTLAERMMQFAMTKPGVNSVDLNGTLQVAYGFDGVKYTPFDPDLVIPPGDPSLPDPALPSPWQPFLSGDAWHLHDDGYKALAQAQFDGFYASLLAGQVFHINAGLNDAWTDPLTPGQGFFITVFPDIGQIFLAWFTYDTMRPPAEVKALLGDPGHRWLTAFGSYVDNRAVLDIEVTQGGIFDASGPSPTQELDGTIILEFSDCNTGTVSYDIPSVERQGVIPIERIALDNVPLCESLQAQLQQTE